MVNGLREIIKGAMRLQRWRWHQGVVVPLSFIHLPPAHTDGAGAHGLRQTLSQVPLLPRKALLPDSECSSGISLPVNLITEKLN